MDHRVPPNNIEAEKSVLGCCMSDYETMNRVTAVLQTEAFYQPNHRLIYEAILRLSMGGHPVDTLTVAAELESHDQLQQCGGNTYIMSLPDAAPLLSNAMHYAKVVHENYLLRRLLTIMEDIRGRCYTEADDAGELIDLASRKIYEIRSTDTISGLESLKEVLSRTINEISAVATGRKTINAVKTGFAGIDRILTGGFRGGTLNILAARPGMGKTALALNIAQKIATGGDTPVVIFSLEMSKEEIVNRMLSAQTRIDSRKLRAGEIEPGDWQSMGEAVPILSSADIWIDDRTNNTPVEMLAKCRQLKMENKCGMVIIDYLQLMTGHRRMESRQQEISDISRSLKVMAKELDVPVIALSQLSRAVESRKDARPLLSDLRESGAIEQDADSVMFIYREDYYNLKEEAAQDRFMEDAELIFAKNRAGATGTVRLGWIPQYTLFVEPSIREAPTDMGSSAPLPPPPEEPPAGFGAELPFEL